MAHCCYRSSPSVRQPVTFVEDTELGITGKSDILKCVCFSTFYFIMVSLWQNVKFVKKVTKHSRLGVKSKKKKKLPPTLTRIASVDRKSHVWHDDGGAPLLLTFIGFLASLPVIFFPSSERVSPQAGYVRLINQSHVKRGGHRRGWRAFVFATRREHN